jgi:putative tributyrin esterase
MPACAPRRRRAGRVVLATVRFPSRALGRHVAYSVLLPDPARHGRGPFPVLYQLHGAGDDHTAWLIYSNLERYVRPMPLIVVMPDGGRSRWRNAGPRERYEDFLTQDLPEHLAGTFRVRPGRHAIGGLSMGGYGAVLIGLRRPDLFCSIWSHSGALRRPSEWPGEGSAPEAAEADDVYVLAERLAAAPRPSLPRLGLDCGREDALLGANRAFHAHLEAVGLPHTYREHPGGHTWAYWDLHVRDALRQHAAALGLPPPADA